MHPPAETPTLGYAAAHAHKALLQTYLIIILLPLIRDIEDANSTRVSCRRARRRTLALALTMHQSLVNTRCTTEGVRLIVYSFGTLLSLVGK